MAQTLEIRRSSASLWGQQTSLRRVPAVSSPRGKIIGMAMVTKRLRPMKIDGKPVWQIGFPIHWGYAGNPGHTGPLANFLTPSAMDPNSWTPEFKTFAVKVEKA